MVSQAYVEGFYIKPRIDLELLRAHSEGLIGLSACLAGEIPKRLLNGNFDGAREYALMMQEIFGEGNFYLELQDHGIREQQEVNRGSLLKNNGQKKEEKRPRNKEGPKLNASSELHRYYSPHI